ncbi:MAG: N-acyl-D-glutamate deacylase [Oscillospiraceae bacterium]
MFDLAIKNGHLIDPEAGKIITADLYIKNGTIEEITREELKAYKVIDADGNYVSPGFIDIHTHIEGHAENGALMAQQGVTTVVNGNCGYSPKNPCEFLDEQDKNGFIVNQAELVGAIMLRELAGVTDPFMPMTTKQIDYASGILKEQLEAGAAGLSFGLEYSPGSSSEEVLALSKMAAMYGKLVAIHTRTDCYAGLEALDEAIDINRITGAPVQISHVVYQYGYGMMESALQMIDDAVRAGYDISCDSGMYTSFATKIGTPVFEAGCFQKWKCSYDSILASTGPNAGQRMSKEIYENYRMNYPNEVAIALIGCPNEIDMAFDLPYMMVSSDSGVNKTGETSQGHPQDAGTFPRFFNQLVRKTSRLTLLDAVKRVTLLPAERMGLEKKGRMRVGNDADLTIFDPVQIIDRSKFPHEGRCDELPDGISYVILGGKVVVEKKKIRCANAGKSLKMPCSYWSYR